MKRSTGSAKRSGSMLTVVSVVIIAAFLAASAAFVVPHMQKHLDDKAMKNGDKEATVAFLANEKSMSVEDYLAQYGLSVNDTVNENTLESDMAKNMTIANYNNYAGEGSGIDLTQFSDAVTDETVYKDLLAMPAKTALGDTVFENTKQLYGVKDDAVTDETSFEDFQKILYDAAAQQAANAQNTAAESTPGTESTNAQTGEATPAASAE